MSRRDEVAASYKAGDIFDIHTALDLADEIDALRAEADPDALTICYLQGQASRDRVITELLAMLKPGAKPEYPDAPMAVWKAERDTYARACEIAGRTE